MGFNKLNTINLIIDFKQITLFEKCLLYNKKLNILQINFLNKSYFSIPLKIFYKIKKFVIDKYYKMIILIDTLNQILFIQRPLFIISHIVKTKEYPYNIHISRSNKLIALIYKNCIEIWSNRKKYSIVIQKLKKIKIIITKFIQSEISHDLKHIVILDKEYLITFVTINNKAIKIQSLRNCSINFVKKLFLHYLLLFVSKKKILTFMRILITISNNKHILYWYQTKYKKNLNDDKFLKILNTHDVKWSVRKKYYLLIKKKRLTDVCLNTEKSLILAIYEKNMIFIFSIINLKLVSKLIFKNQYFFYLKTKKNIIFLRDFLTNDFVIIDISLKKLIFIFINEKNPIKLYSISRDCLYILLAFQKSFIRLGELKNLKMLIILLNITSMVTHLLFLNKTNYFLISSGFKTIRIFSFLNFKLYKIFYLPENFYINMLTIDENDNYLAGVCDINKVLIWNITTSLLVKTFRIHHLKITTLIIIKNGTEIVTGSLDKTVKIFTCSTSKKKLLTLNHENLIIDLKYEILNNCIFSLTGHNYLYIWQGNAWYLKKIINLQLFIQRIYKYSSELCEYKKNFIKRFSYIKKHLILLSNLSILIVFFINSIFNDDIKGILIYNLSKPRKDTSKYFNKSNLTIDNCEIGKKFSVREHHEKIFIIYKSSFELNLYTLNTISKSNNLEITTQNAIKKKDFKKLEKIKKNLKYNNIFLVSETLFSYNTLNFKSILTKLEFLEITSLFFVLIFNVLILLKFQYSYINLKQLIKIISETIPKKLTNFTKINIYFLSLQKYYYRKYFKIISFLLSFFFFIAL